MLIGIILICEGLTVPCEGESLAYLLHSDRLPFSETLDLCDSAGINIYREAVNVPGMRNLQSQEESKLPDRKKNLPGYPSML